MLAAAALILMFAVATTAEADEGLDLAVVIDRSASMQRELQSAALLPQMALDLLARNAAAYRVEHRLAVIGFGSSASIDVPFTRATSGELPQLRRHLADLPLRARGSTDVRAALALAEKMFGELAPNGARHRAIVLFTDGVPYVRGADMAVYRSSLQKFVAADLARAGITLHVLLLPPREGTPDTALWRAVTREVHAAGRSPRDVLAAAHGTIARLAGTQTALAAPSKSADAAEVLVVPPYLETVVFDIFAASPDVTVEVFPPGSTTPLRGGANGVESLRLGYVLSTIVVPRPTPGEWLIRKSRADARVRILSQQFFPRGVLVEPGQQDSLRQHDRVPLAYRIVDGSGQAINELPGYAFALELALTRPDGVSATFPMERSTGEPALFRSTVRVECDLPGRYWTNVRITASDDAGHRFDVFRDRWSGFSVAPAIAVDCRVRAADRSAWSPVSLHIACFSPPGQPIDIASISNGTPAALFRPVLSRDGNPADSSLDMSDAGGGAYAGNLLGTLRGGSYRLQLEADRARLREAYTVRFLPDRLSFVRRSPIGWCALPLLICGVLAVILRRRKTKA